MRGPIDYIVVSFQGSNFNGKVLQAIEDALDKGIISLVALALVIKDADGEVRIVGTLEAEDKSIAEFYEKFKPSQETLDQDDMEEVADLLENDTAAGLLVIEQLWAIPLKKALIEANGTLVAEGRIHPEAALELSGKEA